MYIIWWQGYKGVNQYASTATIDEAIYLWRSLSVGGLNPMRITDGQTGLAIDPLTRKPVSPKFYFDEMDGEMIATEIDGQSYAIASVHYTDKPEGGGAVLTQAEAEQYAKLFGGSPRLHKACIEMLSAFGETSNGDFPYPYNNAQHVVLDEMKRAIEVCKQGYADDEQADKYSRRDIAILGGDPSL